MQTSKNISNLKIFFSLTNKKEIQSCLVSFYSDATWLLLNFSITLQRFARFDIFFLLHHQMNKRLVILQWGQDMFQKCWPSIQFLKIGSYIHQHFSISQIVQGKWTYESILVLLLLNSHVAHTSSLKKMFYIIVWISF